ncbi:hypothetical protein C922_01929 [Plasmodium inui San Antonio 1]|uniref:Zinc finger protein n=1 Tax=Plasmodium inui San Antonio 1 TaxID=1237626 RepID=W7A7V9_9APIC|nr:hypothetical protein C922_01929 [Plasmodium inui San Antonio 1]EUD67740.1 hypothetical protein C922_01929 [Plasmodium inui San Antonio 1]
MGDALGRSFFSDPTSRYGIFFFIPPPLKKKIGTDKYIITPAEHSLNSQYNVKKLWIIVKDLPDKSYALHENDIIKLGRFRLKVRQFIDSVDTLNSLKLDDCPSKKCESILDSSNIQCRICLIEGNQENDPLICPCDCKGSIKYAHLMCLRKWINGRLNLNDQLFSGSVFIKDICCELCKTKYPKSIKQNDELVQLVKIPNLKTPLIVLDNIIGQTSKGVHLISFADKKHLKLGRGHESDVRIPDVSISRYHATIKYEKGLFKLEDHNSKFGTLVALRKAREICPKDTMSLQVGRSVVNFRVDEEIPFTSGTIDIIENKEVIEANELPPANEKNNVESPQMTNPNLENTNGNNFETNHYVDLTNSTNSMQNSYSSYRVDNLMSLLNYQNEYRIFGIRNCYNLNDNGNGNQQNGTQMDCGEGGNNINMEGSNLQGGEINNNDGMIGEQMGMQNGIQNGMQMGVQMDLQMDLHMGLQIGSDMRAQNNHSGNPSNDEERACNLVHRVQCQGDNNDASHDGHNEANNNNNDEDNDEDNNGDNSNDEEGDDLRVHDEEDDDDDENGSDTNNTGSSGGNSGGTSGAGSTGGNSNGNEGSRNEHEKKNSNQSNSHSSNDNNDCTQDQSSTYHGSSTNPIGTSTPTCKTKICSSSSYDHIVHNDKSVSNICGDQSRSNENEVGTYCVNMAVQRAYTNRSENLYNNCKGDVSVVISKYDNGSFIPSAGNNNGSQESGSYPIGNNIGEYTKVSIEDNYFFRNESKTPQQVQYYIDSGIVNDMLTSNSSTSLKKIQDPVMKSGYHNQDLHDCSFVQSVYHINGKNDHNVINVMYSGSNQRINHNGIYVSEAHLRSEKFLQSLSLQSHDKAAASTGSSNSSSNSGIHPSPNFLDEISESNNGSNYNSRMTVFPTSINSNNCSINSENAMLPPFVENTSSFVHDLGDNQLSGVATGDELNNSGCYPTNGSSSGVQDEGVILGRQPQMQRGSNDPPTTSEGKETVQKNKMKKGNLQKKNVILDTLDRKNPRKKKFKRSVNSTHVETPPQQHMEYSNENTHFMGPCNHGSVHVRNVKVEGTFYDQQCSVSKYAKSDFLKSNTSAPGISGYSISGKLSLSSTFDSASPTRGGHNYYYRKKPYHDGSIYNEKFYYQSSEDYKFGNVKESYNKMSNLSNSTNDRRSSGTSFTHTRSNDGSGGNYGIGGKLHLKQYAHSLDYYNGNYKLYNVMNFNEKFSVHRNTSFNHFSTINSVSNKFTYHTQGWLMRSRNVQADFLLNNYGLGAATAHFDMPIALYNNCVGGSDVFVVNPENGASTGNSGSNSTGITNQQNNIHNEDNGKTRNNSIVEANQNYQQYINESQKGINGEKGPTDDRSINIETQLRYDNNNIAGDYNFHLARAYRGDVLRGGRGKEAIYDGSSYGSGDLIQTTQVNQLNGYTQNNNFLGHSGSPLSMTNKDLFSKEKKYFGNGGNIHCNRSGNNSADDPPAYTQPRHSYYHTQLHKKINPSVKKNDEKRTSKMNKNQNDRSSDSNIRKVKNGRRLRNKNDKSGYHCEGFQTMPNTNSVGSKIALESSRRCDQKGATHYNNSVYNEDTISIDNTSNDHMGSLDIPMNSNHVTKANITKSQTAEFANLHPAAFIPNDGMYFHMYNPSGISGHPNVPLSIISNEKKSEKRGKLG